MRHGGAEGLDVLGEGVVWVCEPSVQIADSVIGLVFEVQGVGIVDQSCAEGEGELRLEVAEETVHESGRESEEDPRHAVSQEYVRLPVDD